MKKRFRFKPEFIFIIGIILVIGLLFLLIYGAYHNHQEQLAITSGYVIDKDYNAPYTSYSSQTVNGNSISVPVYHGASYTILVKSDDGRHQAWYDVTPLIYDKIKIGDHLNNVNRELK